MSRQLSSFLLLVDFSPPSTLFDHPELELESQMKVKEWQEKASTSQLFLTHLAVGMSRPLDRRDFGRHGLHLWSEQRDLLW